MKIGMIFPQLEIGTDPLQIRDFAQAIEALGFDYLSTYEHVFGADPANYQDGRTFIYTYKHMFHEPMVLFGYLAGLTQKIELTTGILILPQRDTAVVAKQAAELALLSNGRFRLGVGVGWNQAEMEGLGYDFRTRGDRMDEQIMVMKALWEKPLVTFEGKYHHLYQLGIHPRPMQPIPLWFGGSADAVLKRAAQWGDGWVPATIAPDRIEPTAEKMHTYLKEYGRTNFGIDCQVTLSKMPDETARRDFVLLWKRLGATHIRINTMGNKYTLDQHLKAAESFKEMVQA